MGRFESGIVVGFVFGAFVGAVFVTVLCLIGYG